MTGDATPLPLADVRVVELGQLLAGPFCGQLLGDFGAEVIKGEDPGRGDPMRQWGREKPYGMSLWWPVVARNKKSVTANLRDPRGQDLVRRLAAESDVLLENFRPGTLERWGLGPEQLWEINPRLIVTRVTGYGQTGPYAPRAGFGSIGEAMGGIRYITGDADRPPSRAGGLVRDRSGGGADAVLDPHSLPAGVSRMVLGAQEDLRREITRAIHDGPAQSLTNIVLQAQIVERLLGRDPTAAQADGPRTMCSLTITPSMPARSAATANATRSAGSGRGRMVWFSVRMSSNRGGMTRGRSVAAGIRPAGRGREAAAGRW